VLFPEPGVARTTWLGWSEPKVHWLTECSITEAAMSRATVNEWYRQFPDPDGRFALRLQSEVDVDHLQALDELFVHWTLRRRHDDVRYEEGGVGPDFRVYEQGELVLAVEVATLFMRSDWNDEDRRHNRLADELNQRVRPTQGYFVSFDIKAAPSEPAPRHFAEWVTKELGKLPPHTNLSGAGYGDIPTATYERNGVRIDVRFLPMKADARTKSDPEARIVGMGRMTGGFVNSGSRLKDAISKKGGDRYDIGGVPYVVAVGNRDNFLSGDVVFDGMYGGDAVRFDLGDPSRFEAVRKNDGLFGYDPARQQARHSRISAVAVLSGVRLWDPTTADVALYDNLSPVNALPDGLFPTTRRFAQVSAGGEFGWRPV
jgi:hypothetical protein